MQGLFKTSKAGKGKSSHYHIVYINEDKGFGIATNANNHSHAVSLMEQTEEGGPFEESGWYLQENDGHTHTIEEYEVATPKLNEREEDIVQEVAQMFFEAEALEKDSRTRAYESEDMYMHKQWDEQIKKKLESEDRAAITVNKLEQKLDNLCGYQRQNRTDFKFLPQEGSDQAVADILTHLVKHLTEQCYYSREESKVFEDCALTGRGLFNIYEDFDNNIQGDIIIERFPWDEGYMTSHRKEDLSDCDAVFKEKWFSERKLKELYPDKFEKFSEEIKNYPVANEPSEDWDKRLRTSEFIDKTAKKYRMVERQMKVYKRSTILFNTEDGWAFDAYGWKEADINAVRQWVAGFVKIPRVSHQMRITKIVSDVLVEDNIIDGETDFSLLPLYAKKRNDEFWGKLEGAKDLNRLINKAYSQFVDIINKVANYGWFYDSETFPDKKDKEAFVKNSAKAGFVSQIRDVARPPHKVEGVRFPSELTNAIQMFNNDMREIMNINLEMMGDTQSATSGVAMKQKIVQQLLGNDYLFDNLAFVKKKMGSLLVKKIAKLYTPERIMNIVSQANARAIAQGENPIEITMEGEDGKVEARPFNEIDPKAIERILNEADLTKNDVIVSESDTSASAMMGNFLMLMELAGKGVAIPPEAILEFAPIPQKDRIIAQIQQAQQQALQAEQAKNQTEITKTMIAHQGKEPSPSRQPIMPGGDDSQMPQETAGAF